MGDLFLKTLKMSIAASWLILAVVLLRFVLKKVPTWVNVLLWGIVAIRLICPVTIESPASMIPDSVGSGELISEWANDYIGNVNIHHPNSVHYDAAIGAGREPISDGKGGYYVVTRHDQLSEPATIKNTVVPVLSVMWVAGMTVMVFYAVISFWHLRRKVNEAVMFKGSILLCDHVKSPFILGLIRPKIYLPSNMDTMAMEPVIAHEKAHLARCDHWWKPLGFLILAVHWFNPLCWIAYVLLCRDIEMACDEKVIRQMDLDGKKLPEPTYFCAGAVSPTAGWLVISYLQGMAIADTYVYRTADGGLTWTETNSPVGTEDNYTWLPSQVGFLSVDRLLIAYRLYNGTPVFLTKDGGTTWEALEMPQNLAYEVENIRVDGNAVTISLSGNAGSMVSRNLGDIWELELDAKGSD